jgi:hypothetical protein
MLKKATTSSGVQLVEKSRVTGVPSGDTKVAVVPVEVAAGVAPPLVDVLVAAPPARPVVAVPAVLAAEEAENVVMPLATRRPRGGAGTAPLRTSCAVTGVPVVPMAPAARTGAQGVLVAPATVLTDAVAADLVAAAPVLVALVVVGLVLLIVLADVLALLGRAEPVVVLDATGELVVAAWATAVPVGLLYWHAVKPRTTTNSAPTSERPRRGCDNMRLLSFAEQPPLPVGPSALPGQGKLIYRRSRPRRSPAPGQTEPRHEPRTRHVTH